MIRIGDTSKAKCLGLLDHPEAAVRATAATCLGHVARLHRRLDLDIVLPRLTGLASDAAIGGEVQDAMDDILTYLARSKELDSI